MKAWKSLALIFLLILSIQAVAAQGLGGADMTVEESLVNFVSEVLGVSVTSASDVLLYLVAPIIGFYFLISNFGKEGYNHFQERLERREYYESEEDLPTGMKLFSLITSFITVVSVGRIAPSLILIIGGLAFLLGVMMFLGLFNFGGNDGDGNGGGDDGGDAGGGNGNENNDDDTTRGDYIERISDAAKDATGAAVNHLEQRYENQLEESLGYFESDMLQEIESTRSRIPELESALSQAENEMNDPENYDPSGDPEEHNPRVFQRINQKCTMIEKLLEGMGGAIEDDFRTKGRNPDYTGSELAKFVANEGGIARKHGRNPMEEIEILNNKLERALESDAASPPDDVFNEIMNNLGPLIATAHFVSTSPFKMPEIASNRETAEKLLMKAASLNKIKDISGRDETAKLQNLAGWLDARVNILKNIIKRSEKLCRKEMKFTEREVEIIKQSLGEDKKIHHLLKNIKDSLNRYSDIKNLKQDVEEAEDMMIEIDNKLATLESQAKSHGKFESEIYQKLREVEEKI